MPISASVGFWLFGKELTIHMTLSELKLSSQLIIFSYYIPLNLLPNDNFFDWSKLKEFADKKSNVIKKKKKIPEKDRKHCQKRRKFADFQHFLLFPKCIQYALSSRSLKVGIVW